MSHGASIPALRVLHRLKLEALGPADVDVEFGSRLTIVTGDNSLGKSFLLDTAWWGGTRSWPGDVAEPRSLERSRIEVDIEATTGRTSTRARFRAKDRSWVSEKVGTFPKPQALFVYVRTDGSVSLWDPARDYNRAVGESSGDDDDAPPARLTMPGMRGLHLDPQQIMRKGLEDEDGNVLVPALVDEWLKWQLAAESMAANEEDRATWSALTSALTTLSAVEEPLTPGRPVDLRSSPDSRSFPSLLMPWGEDVPVVHASAGIQRAISLAYLLTWSWREHGRLVEVADRRAKGVVLLVDEPETHLHPRWQRTILPSILGLGSDIDTSSPLPLQVIVATHSPHVVASVEAVATANESQNEYDGDLDETPQYRLFTLRLHEIAGGRREVRLDRTAWRKVGSVGAWLTSSTFGLSGTSAREAEDAKCRARDLVNASPKDVTNAKIADVEDELRRVLASEDPFWAIWLSWLEDRGAA